MPQSRYRYTLNERVEDPASWFYTWDLADDVTFASACDFCGQGEQRITYGVHRSDDRMQVCARCAGRYPISGAIDGLLLDVRTTRDQIHGLTARLKQQTCQDVIRQVQTVSPDPALEEALVYFDRNLQLSPLRAAIIFLAMPSLPHPVDVRIFEVQTRSNAHQEEFGSLDEAQRRAVWAALSPQQRRRIASLGFAPRDAILRQPRGKRRPGVVPDTISPRMAVLSDAASPQRQPD
ncbi:hypothetical protein SAMN06295905_2498 [Devosia lucknowensis]|uniref:Uncharacterized protein n=1 Tax=Devosia lucknowensis TaxID=1096929 RepID=A0A1Y6FP05_9HYPH|nr:hypothetical protein [Devosia lucknowensis]SMQ75996.1 hypothetical protein SAMN06295905_2498 [Devosia lucknowensis]